MRRSTPYHAQRFPTVTIDKLRAWKRAAPAPTPCWCAGTDQWAVILADELTGSLDRSADEQVADGQWELGRGPLTRARS